MTVCYIGLGSNLASPRRQLHQAIQALRHLPRSTVHRVSRMYLSRPLGLRAQPLFYNMVAELYTSLSALQLLHACQGIEKKHHRVRKIPGGARTLDLDLLLFGHQTLHTKQLMIPHPELLQRDFVTQPLLELAPQICMPDGRRVNEHLAHKEIYCINTSRCMCN